VSLWTVLREAAHERPNDDPRAIAHTLLDTLTRDDLIALLADEIAGQQRMRVCGIERREFAPPPRPAGVPEDFAPRLDPFAALRGERIALGNGQQVEWHLATVEQHAERVAMLDRMRQGLGRTIERHQLAIRLIRDAGVSCLADLEKLEAPKARKRSRVGRDVVAEAAD